MAINFPNSPTQDQIFTSGDTTWQWSGTAWNVVTSEIAKNVFTRFNADSGNTTADAPNDVLRVSGGTNITTSITGDELTIDFSGSVGSTQNLFSTITADEGQTTAESTTDTLNILGGTNISTSIATDTKDVTVNMNAFSINFLSDVDTQSSAPTTGQVLKWDGSKWAPAADIASGGAGLDADTLDGFDSAYYLNYNNFTNTPNVATLTDFSVGIENTPSGNGAIDYDNTTGVFKFTPPTAAGLGALTSVAFADLTATPTTISGYGITDAVQDFADLGITPTTIAGYGITDAFDGQYASLTGAPSIPADIGDLTDTGNLIPDTLLELGISDGTNGQVLTTDGSGNFSFTTVTSSGGGEENQNAFSIISVSGQSNVEADAKTDTLTLTAGTGISLTTDAGADSITITNTVSAPSDITDLTDVTTAGIDVSKIYEPAIVMLRVDNVGTSAYTFNSHYSGNNPTVYALSGTTIAFDLSNSAGHPFEIQDPLSTPYNTGLVHVAPDGTVSTGSNAQGQEEGVLYWRIPESVSGGYRYQCQLHIAMVGAIQIKRFSTI